MICLIRYSGRLLGLILLAACLISMAAPMRADNTSERLMRLDSANYYIGIGRLDDAERNLKSALNLEPASRENALLLYNLGMVQTAENKYDEALTSYSTGLIISPASTQLLTSRAALMLSRNYTGEAIQDLNKALEIDSTLVRPRLLRGIAHLSQNNYAEAERDLGRYLETEDSDDYALALMARACEALGNRHEAETLLRKAIGLAPDPQYHFDLCRMIILDDNLEDARSAIQDAIISFPDYGPLYMLRGYIHRKRYRPTEALADREIALRKGVDPAMVNAWIPAK